jgi:hypothetical protein
MIYSDQLREIANRFYRESGYAEPPTKQDIAAWAIRKGLWHPHPSDLIEQCAEELARAMREEHIRDAQGRSVRAKHVARMPGANGTRYLWDDIRSAKPAFMEIAFQQRRQQIVGDCRQLKTDVDSYNENAKPEKEIQVVFDFRRDLEELEQQDSDAA